MMTRLFKKGGCFIIAISVLLIIISILYLIPPGKSNILLMGIDAREEEGTLGRTDTLIVASFDHLKPYVGILSIPRDLWVVIPGYGENRINTAHFFAEAQIIGNGPFAAMEVVEYNFGIKLDHFVRIKFINIIELIDIIGGVDLILENPMAGFPAGEHHLNGDQALTFIRDRSGSDDFFRMERGQLMLQAVFKKIVNINNWKYLPHLFNALYYSIDSNIPIYQYPRLILTFIRTYPDNINFRIISRDLVIPFTTSGGADVLAPNWELIHPLIHEIFNQ